MATKDYVRRPQKRKPKKTKQQAVPWLRICVAIVLIALFIFALYVLQKTPVEDQDTAGTEDSTTSLTTTSSDATLEQPLSAKPANVEATEIAPAPIGEAPKQLAPLPVLGEEDWAYIDSLPEFNVEIDATGPEQSDKEYILQCGSFRTSKRAEELKATIAFQGLEARVKFSDDRGGQWYRVIVGPYQSKRTAENDRHQLRGARVNGCKIYMY
jgi:cell division protein FtsN